MRDGYKMVEAHHPPRRELLSPANEPIANFIQTMDGYGIHCHLDELNAPASCSISELSQVASEISDEHYKLITPRWQQFQTSRKAFLGDPLWGWLAFVVTAVVAILGCAY